MQDWRWFLAVWTLAGILLAVGLIAANSAIVEFEVPGATNGR